MRIRTERIPTLVAVLSLTLLALGPGTQAEIVQADVPSNNHSEGDGQ
jgi:hypothetical protein